MNLMKNITLNNRAWSIWWNLCPGTFVSAFLYSISSSLTLYGTLWLSSRIITELSERQDPKTLIRLALIQLLFTAALTFIKAVLGRLKNYYADSASCLYQKIYIDKMLSLDYHHMDSQAVYDRYSQIIQNDKWASLGIHETLVLFEQFTSGAVQVLGGMVVTAPLFFSRVSQEYGKFALLDHPLCAFVMAALLLFITVLSSACADNVQAYWIRYSSQTRFGNRLADFYESSGRDRKRALDMRLYRQQERVSKIYMERCYPFQLSSEIVRQAKGPMGLWAALSRSVSVIPVALVYLFVCLKARAGAFGPGYVTLYAGAITNLLLGLGRLSDTFGRMTANGAFLKEAYEFLDIQSTMYQGSLTTEKRSDRQYDIEFRDVSFRYPGTDSYVLCHVNLRFPIGTRLAVVGMNGSGKTTFIKLLCRLYEPTSGQILLNGIDIRKYKYSDYIRLFSVVFQDFKLFSLPLGENLAGTVQVDSDKAADCLKKAGFINWETVCAQGLSSCLYRDLDETGTELSGGEAQKTAIARAIYKDAPFIIMDEPTAALDPVAEAEIYENFGNITGDRTAICISHRLSSCRFCDQIAVFHQGTIVQLGTHQQLVTDKTGKYYELWKAQEQYYTEEKAQSP